MSQSAIRSSVLGRSQPILVTEIEVSCSMEPWHPLTLFELTTYELRVRRANHLTALLVIIMLMMVNNAYDGY